MNNPFKYLEVEEWRALIAHAETRRFKPGGVLLAEGSVPGGLYVIRNGEVKVCREPGGYRLVIAELGPGSVFGEMSFIESEPPDVSVIAKTAVDALYISHKNLNAAIDKNPVLYGRFYQSLAWILSRRLRATTGQVTKTKGDAWKDD